MSDIDKLKLLRGKPIVIDDKVVLYQPTIGQIEESGEARFMGVFYNICSCAWDHPATLADMGVDFMEIGDWEYFYSTVRQFTKEDTSLIFGDLDFSLLVPCNYQKDDVQEIVLTNTEPLLLGDVEYEPGKFIFNEQLYKDVIPYVREMIGFTHSGRKAGNKATAKVLIMEDRKRTAKNQGKPYESMFHNGIISLVNTEEFPYTYESAYDLTIYQFMKSLIQIQGKKQAVALLQGSMSGFMDTKSIPSKNFQWTYSDEKYADKTQRGKTLKDSFAPNGGKVNVK